MEKVLSFDPGIINLSYCLLSNNDILSWDTVNLLPPEKCNAKYRNGNTCKNLSTYKENEIYYCGIHKTKDSKPLRKISTRTIDYKYLTDLLIKFVNNLNIENPTRIYIENQRKSTERIKFVSNILFALLYQKYNCPIQFINGSAKFKHCKDNIYIRNKRKRYCNNKKKATDLCKKIIEEKYIDWLEKYESFTKKDDLADSFLLSYYFFN